MQDTGTAVAPRPLLGGVEVELLAPTVRLKAKSVHAALLMVLQEHSEGEQEIEGEVDGRRNAGPEVLAAALAYWIRRGLRKVQVEDKKKEDIIKAEYRDEEAHAL